MTKSRADLEAELNDAYSIKIAAEDRLTTDRLAPLNDQLSKTELRYRELNEEYDRAVEEKDAISAELQEALEAADDVETVSEELRENDTLLSSLRSEVDNNTSTIAELHQGLEALKSEYDVHLEEIEMAKLNDEHTGLLERKLQVMESAFNEMVAELHQLETACDDLSIKIQEAEDARESSEFILEAAEDRVNLVTNLESQILALDATIEDRRGALEEHWDTIEDLKEEVERVIEEVAADNDIVAEQTAVMASISEQLANYQNPIKEKNEGLETLVAKLNETTCHEDVYGLAEDLKKLGFTFGMTNGGRTVLCCVKEGKLVADKVLENFIFVGDPNNIYEHFTDNTVEKIVDFVRQNASVPCQLESKEPVAIINEDKQLAVDILAESKYEA